MKAIITAAVLGVVLLAAYFPIPTWEVLTNEAKVAWEMPEDGERGVFDKISATIQFDADDLKKSSIEASVDVLSINTGNAKLDGHLRSPDFFDAGKYPEMTFKSKSFSVTDEGFMVKGQLKVKETVNDVEIPFTFSQNENRGLFVGSFKIHTKKVGIMWDSIKSKDENAEPNLVITMGVPVVKK